MHSVASSAPAGDGPEQLGVGSSMRHVWIAVLVVLSAMGGCSSDSTEGQSGSVRVFAAASLSDAFAEIADTFELVEPGVNVELNLAGSSSLREQILAGAPADVLASANEEVMAELDDAGELAGPARTFATNSMEIAVPAGNPGDVAGLESFAQPDLLIGLCADTVPCGIFARQVLSNAGIMPSIDTNEADVRALLTRIRADELDAGLVYVTDVLAAGDDVEGIPVPASANVEATYPIAVLAGAPNSGGAALFVDFVLSEDGRAILSAYGFATP